MNLLTTAQARHLTLGVALVSVLAMGCGRETPEQGSRIPPIPNAPARYGTSTVAVPREIPRVQLLATNQNEWASSSFYVVETELSPATLVHSATRHLGLFTGMTQDGLGAPTFVAWATPSGPRTFKRGEALDVTRMDQSWILVWWAGAEGWTNWDCPWVVYLQHKPDSMRLDEDGLHLEFPEQAGDVVLLPLYGYDKPPQQGRDFAAEHGLAGSKVKVKTWEWPKVITRDPLTRIRYWAAATRNFPLHCAETFSVDQARDSVVLRSHIQWRSIADDWKTPGIKLAPISPPLAQAAQLGDFPVTFSQPWFDLDLSTPSGPYMAVEGVDQFDAIFSVLQYVNETERVGLSATNTLTTAALNGLRVAVSNHFASTSPVSLQNQFPTWCRSIANQARLARALPYLEPAQRKTVVAGLGQYLREHVLLTNHFDAREIHRGTGRRQLILARACSDSEENLANPTRFHSHLLETVWAYAHFSGDWDLVRERWPLLKELFTAPAAVRWAGFAQDSVTAIANQAAPCAAFARLAYQARDLDSYRFGCAIFARELVHLFLKQRGADYFRQHQPRHSMEFMEGDVFLIQMLGGAGGWQIDGPKYPAMAGARLFEKRWGDFLDGDVARFYRDHLKEDVRRELKILRTYSSGGGAGGSPSVERSLVPLRSLVLNEKPAELAAAATPGQTSPSPSQTIAECLSILHPGQAAQFERLIPGTGLEPSPFVIGHERTISQSNPSLLTPLEFSVPALSDSIPRPAWPRLTWPEWKTRTGANWTFGALRPVPLGSPRQVKVFPLNSNTRVITFQFLEER